MSKEKKNNWMSIGAWVFSVFCILCLPVYGFEVGAILLCLLGIAALPIKPIKDWWNKILKGKNFIKIIILTVAFFAFILMLPSTETEPGNENETTTHTEQSSDNEDSTTKSDEESSSKEPTSSETETTSKEETSSKEETTTEQQTTASKNTVEQTVAGSVVVDLNKIPAYSGSYYVAINNNTPYFSDKDLVTTSYEYYSSLDSLGRCGITVACIGKDIMPTGERGEIGSVKPTGWHTVKYDCVDGKYLYNRCHLIGWQLTGENANTKNLITGTRQMNVDGMLPFENMVADYVKETGNHVMYRVIPVFSGKNLVATGVQMEAYSVEDNGVGICFNVFVYNTQDGVNIDYATGDSSTVSSDNQEPTTQEPTKEEPTTEDNSSNTGNYAVNMKNGKIHMVGECSATGDGDNAMTDVKYFNTYEEAEAYSIQIAPKLEKRKCGNCW